MADPAYCRIRILSSTRVARLVLSPTLFRKLGYRTQKEIERERYALKAFRGDFDDIHSQMNATKDVGRVLDAVHM